LSSKAKQMVNVQYRIEWEWQMYVYLYKYVVKKMSKEHTMLDMYHHHKIEIKVNL